MSLVLCYYLGSGVLSVIVKSSLFEDCKTSWQMILLLQPDVILIMAFCTVFIWSTVCPNAALCVCCCVQLGVIGIKCIAVSRNVVIMFK